MKMFGENRNLRDLAGIQAPRPKRDLRRAIDRIVNGVILLYVAAWGLALLFPRWWLTKFMIANWDLTLLVLVAVIALAGMSKFSHFSKRNF